MNRLKIFCVGVVWVLLLLLFFGSSPASPAQSHRQQQQLPQAPGCTPVGAPRASSEEKQIAQAVFRAINQDRSDNYRPPLAWNASLENSARQHDLAMQKAHTLSHQLPGEAELGEREHDQCVRWSWAGENIGENSDQTSSGALALHQAMMAEQPPDDGHKQNILSPHFTSVGVEVLIDQEQSVLWLTEDFADV